MFKTIIVKTSYKPLDVVFAATRYRIGCKRFVGCSRKKSDKFAFRGWQRIFIGARLDTAICFGIVTVNPDAQLKLQTTKVPDTKTQTPKSQ